MARPNSQWPAQAALTEKSWTENNNKFFYQQLTVSSYLWYVCTLDVFFRQIKSFMRFCLVFVFGLQTIKSKNFTKIYQIIWSPKTKAKRNLMNNLIWQKNESNVIISYLFVFISDRKHSVHAGCGVRRLCEFHKLILKVALNILSAIFKNVWKVLENSPQSDFQDRQSANSTNNSAKYFKKVPLIVLLLSCKSRVLLVLLFECATISDMIL